MALIPRPSDCLDSSPVTFSVGDVASFFAEPEVPYAYSDSGVRRWSALLGKTEVTDYWQEGVKAEAFQLLPRAFLEHASRNPPPAGKTATVSAFSDWVYSLYVNDIDPVAKEFGLKYERTIFDRRPALIHDEDFARVAPKAWRLAHNGLHLETDREPVASYLVGDLTVGGVGLRASPDLVFINDAEQKGIIVEIKFSRAQLPSNLWPNVWAQLWAYAQIPEFRALKELVVVGEVWTDNGDPQYRQNRKEPDELYLRRTVRRNPRDPKFDRFFRTLFQIYSDALS